MTTTRTIALIFLGAVNLYAGCSRGLTVGGFPGICGAFPFSAGLVGSTATVGAVLAGTMASLWRQVWWAGALAFSTPVLFGAVIGAATGESQRVVGAGICILASALTAFAVRYPGPGSFKQ